MEERPEQPPEGRLIAGALERTGMSIRQASERAKISYGRWRQITSGYQNVSPGSWAKVTGPAGTVARMAAVVGVTADQMAAAGRADVAEILRAVPAAVPAPEERLSIDDVTRQEKEMLLGILDVVRKQRRENTPDGPALSETLRRA